MVSARSALRSISSFSAPGGRSAATARAVLANAASRSSRGDCCLKRRRLLIGALLSIPEEGGSATGVHITDMSQGRGGDAGPIPFEQVRSRVPCSLSQKGLRPAPIGPQGTVEAATVRGDRATAAIENIQREKIRGCSCRSTERPTRCPLCPDSSQIPQRSGMTSRGDID